VRKGFVERLKRTRVLDFAHQPGGNRDWYYVVFRNSERHAKFKAFVESRGS
jgi:hypothetical protein